MKKYFLFLLLLILCSSTYYHANAQTNLNNGLVAYYTFNGNANDSSGNGLHGSLYGCSSTTDRFGNKNAAYGFNGSSDYISVAFDSLLNLTKDKSFSFWYKINTGTSNSPYPCFISMENVYGAIYPTFKLMHLEYYSYRKRQYKILFTFGELSTNYEVTTKQLTTNYLDKWVHIGATYSQKSGMMKVYFNGSFSDSITVGNITSYSTGADLNIGREGPRSGNVFSYYNGEMDDLRFYNRELDSNEIAKLYDKFIDFKMDKIVNACAGDSLKLLFTKNYDLDSNNILTFQLSDSVGNFDNYKAIRISKQFKKGLDSINIYIPLNTSLTNTYKLRVFTSSQKDTLFINNIISVNPLPLNTYSLIGSNIYCKNDTSEIIIDNKISTDSYNWYKNDTIISGEVNYKLKPKSSGIYKVKIKSTFGCFYLPKDTSITIFPRPNINVVLSNDSQCFVGNKLTIQNNTTIESGKVNYEWNFGDSTTSTAEAPIKTYSYADKFLIKLKTITNNNCYDSVNYSVSIFPNPITDFTINNDSQCHVGNRFTYKNQSTISSGSIKYYWELGDSTFSNSNTSITKVYKDTGFYNIKLLVVSNQNCKDSLTMPVVVFPSPKAKFITNNFTQCLNENKYYFTDKSSLVKGTYSTFWNFNDSSNSNVISPLKVYNKEGNYTVTLEITTDQNCKDVTSQYIGVLPSPIASYTLKLDTQCFKNNNFQFQNNSSISNGTNSFYWDFDDNTNSSQISPTKNYSQEGIYNVKLIANASNNCSDTLYDVINVLPSPIASFIINKDRQCAKDDIFKMTNQSTLSKGNIMYEWTFGDGDTSLIKNAGHSYATEGLFVIKLRNISDDNCTDSIQKNVQVYEKPKASFNINSEKQCLNENHFIYLNSSTYNGNGLKSIWDFGNGIYDTLSNPNKKYLDTGIFSVKLFLITENFCTDSIIKNITVLPSPESIIKSINNNICKEDTISFEVELYNKSYNYKWLKDDVFYGDTLNILKVNKQQNIKLVSINQDKCADTSTSISTVFNDLPIQPIITKLNQTLNAGPGYSSYQWYLNNQILNGETTQIVEISVNGNYNVRVTNDDDCSIESEAILVENAGIFNSFQNHILIYPNPTKDIIYIEVKEFSKICVYDMKGILLIEQNIDNLDNQIDVSFIPNGIYMLKIQEGNQTSFAKFIKQK